ncbi:MAG: O-antigen ligase family protein [Solirubrobacterales bacterium]
MTRAGIAPPQRLGAPRPARDAAGAIAAGAALMVTVAVATLKGGGFDASSQSTFVALAGLALLAAGALDIRAASSAAHSELALALLALAALSVTSATWTVAVPATALRSGLVIGGYAAVFVCAATLARRTGPLPFAAVLATLALVEAVLGLRAVAVHALPEAERIDGAWRPGGTFQYPPALAILQVGALPACAALLARRSALACALGAATAALAGAVLGLSGSRLAPALAMVVLIALIVRPPAARTGRAAPLAVAVLAMSGALLAPAILGGRADPGLSERAPGIAQRASGLSQRTLHHAQRGHGLPWRVAGLKQRASGLARGPGSGSPRRGSDFLHGRGREWRAALETWWDHPLLGAGAGAYYTASLPHQGGAPVAFAHDLPLELCAELGLLGLPLAFVLYASSARAIVRAAGTPALWLLAPMVLAFLASNLLDWTWHLAGLGALWAASAGAMQGAGEHRA